MPQTQGKCDATVRREDALGRVEGVKSCDDRMDKSSLREPMR